MVSRPHDLPPLLVQCTDQVRFPTVCLFKGDSEDVGEQVGKIAPGTEGKSVPCVDFRRPRLGFRVQWLAQPGDGNPSHDPLPVSPVPSKMGEMKRENKGALRSQSASQRFRDLSEAGERPLWRPLADAGLSMDGSRGVPLGA